jgi:hypothetical protein
MKNQRNRAWRRFKDRVNARKGMGSDELFKPVKVWKALYGRKQKLIRAKQLGIAYPIKNGRQLLDKEIPLYERSC